MTQSEATAIRDRMAQLEARMIAHELVCEHIQKSNDEFRENTKDLLKQIHGGYSDGIVAINGKIDGMRSDMDSRFNGINSRAWSAMLSAFGAVGMAAVFLFVQLMGWHG